MKNEIKELTPGAVTLGIVIALIMCAANTYLGLYAGMTVSASIPAAVISMGILRGILRKGSILENNIVQTIASAGESLAAGIIFTIPALIISKAWAGFNYWTTTLVALLGGILGILFMIPLRKPLIVENKDLIYPEGVACSDVLKAGEEGGKSVKTVFLGLGIGAVFKFFVSGVSLIKPVLEGAIRIGKSALYFGSDMSVALVGVGYIVGMNIGLLVFLGGVIGWIVGIPIYGLINGFPESDLVHSFGSIWSTQIRYIGVGAMITGGIWSILNVRHSISRGFKEAILGYKKGTQEQNRTNIDLSPKYITIGLFLVIIPIFFLYSLVTSASIGIISTFTMIIAAFFFVAVSSYIVGLVGSSNNPVSGMTIVTVILASILLLIFGMTGIKGLTASLLVAGVVCCSACIAGDISQDLKTGHILKATPKNQQIAQIIGVIVSAFIIAPVLTLLHKSYGIGTGEPGALNAPQASLFAGIVGAMFTGKSLPWMMVLIGGTTGILLIIFDEILKKNNSPFRTHVMPVAVGIYLPLGLSVPIAIGGILNFIIKHISINKLKSKSTELHETTRQGKLVCSGLIAGEAIMGIIIAIFIANNINLPVKILDSNIVSLMAFVIVIGTIIFNSTKKN